MSDYRRFIAYLYEYPNNRKADAAALSAWSRRTASAHGLPDQIAVASAGDLGHGLRIYPPVRRMYGIPLGNLLAGRSSTSGKLFTHSDAIGQTDVTLDELGGLILLCRQTGVIATQWTIFRFSRSFSLPRSRRSPKHPQTMVPDRPKRKLPKHPNLWIPPYLRSPCHHQTLQKHSSMNFPQNSAAIPNFIHKIPTRNPPSPQNPHQLTR